jgi:type 1 glutamine amidotransferase
LALSLADVAGLALLLLGSATLSAREENMAPRVLYITHSAGYRHEVLPRSQAVLKHLGDQSGDFVVTATEDLAAITAETLHRYAAVIFYTSGELPVSDGQKAALLDFVRAGGGFIGLHSATDTFYLWPDYLTLIGGYFNGHPWHQEVSIDVVDRSNPLVSFLAPSFRIADEIYQISDFDYSGSRVLLRLDPASVGMTDPAVRRRFYGWPLAWTRSYGEGRVFYTALGHDDSVWQDARYQQLLLNGVRWAIEKDP